MDTLETQVVDIMAEDPDPSPLASTSPDVPTKTLRKQYQGVSPPSDLRTSAVHPDPVPHGQVESPTSHPMEASPSLTDGKAGSARG